MPGPLSYTSKKQLISTQQKMFKVNEGSQLGMCTGMNGFGVDCRVDSHAFGAWSDPRVVDSQIVVKPDLIGA